MAIATPVTITTSKMLANAALYRCGADAVSTLLDNSKSAQLVNHFLFPTVLEVAEVLPWRCLIDRQDMTAEDTLHQPATGEHAYAEVYDLEPVSPMTPVPLRILDINGDPKIPFHVEGKYLYTDALSASLRYIGKPIFDETGGDGNFEVMSPTFDPLLIDAITARLASKLAFRLTQSIELASMMVQEYITILGIAVKVEAVETNNADLMDLLTFMQEVNPMILLTRNTAQE